MAARLSLSEREEIRAGIAWGESDVQIARRLGRCASTVGREITRNGGRGGYRAVRAQGRADEAARRPKPFKLVADPILAREVTRLLERRYSPRTCVRVLADEGMGISHETIYQACYQPGRGLGPEAWKLLCRRRQRRKHAGHKWGIASGNPLGNPVSVHERHPAAGTREECGHLEGDLMIGAFNQSAVLTLCERLSRYTWLVALPSGYGTEPVAGALHDLLEGIPPAMRRTLAWDQGREMKYWAEVQALTGTPIYFCDPHSPWQRPTVENNNGILRRWLPKGARLDVYTQDDLDRITRLLNDMPREIHGWRTATDVYHDHLVATTT